MTNVLDFVIRNADVLALVATVAESIVMPFVPVKYNGLAVTLFGFLTRKKKKTEVN